ncbi:MAG: hypothetical protein IPL28_12835 [Chloroflexi bacterium]|nr:hypothetical protein [Chloroflexota bacterium]
MLFGGIQIRLGKFKRWWAIRHTPFTPIAYAYAAIPFGISLNLLGLSLLFPAPHEIGNALVSGGMSMFVISIVLAMWRPLLVNTQMVVMVRG